MGFTEPCFRDTDDDLIDQALGSGHPFLAGITRATLDREHSIRLRVSNEGEPFLPFAEGGFGNAGKCDLRTAAIDYEPPVESRRGDVSLLSRYPLELVSPKSQNSLNSTFGYRASTDEETAILHVHRDDAGARGIRSGDPVRVYNDRGSVVLRAEVDGVVRAGVVAAPAVRWPKHASDGRNVNVLVSDRVTDLGGGPVFYSCLVEIEKCGD
jgi:anaerobic selenocysteine-containing dehydrogenase